ncbi:MAG: heterocyst frequency control protein PatD [Moorea sp. SIOASIH]|uniref:heterocyst frequency control protein PatD n=1 Tax=Moorena sp. SIOASIH TaxID=2607817 RepID=UPI0013BE49FF|nr:heterocyst frequency control protein PatD [Moorena sp. SIOASIH]NEO37561.1 heterocyst frequency control protein PatD [Moorena sp. SIOASIH]
MLSELHDQALREFQQALEQMYCQVDPDDLPRSAIQEQFQALKGLFISQIASISASDIPLDYVSRWQSLKTEIYKQMRLLENDLMLLQASRSPRTAKLRQKGICDRIQTLIQYCQGWLQQSQEQP